MKYKEFRHRNNAKKKSRIHKSRKKVLYKHKVKEKTIKDYTIEGHQQR